MGSVLQFIGSTGLQASGPSYSVSRLCESQIERGFDVKILSLDWVEIIDRPDYLNVFPLGFGPKRLGRSPEMNRWVKRESDGRSIDLIHIHTLWYLAGINMSHLAQRKGIPLLVSPRGCFTKYAMETGPLLKKIYWRLKQKPALQGVSCFHATATSEYEDIRRLGFRQPVAIIPNGIDLPERKSIRVKSHKTLLFLSRIHPNKGLDLLLPAWGQIQKRFPKWRLKIVGPDQENHLATAMDLARNLSLCRIEFIEALYGEDKWDAYANADLFVLPSYSENFGIVVAESLSMGTPVITTKATPWRGLVKHDAGWWIDVELNSLVNAMETAMTMSEDTLRRMGGSGRRWMQRSFSWQSVGDQVSEVYEWMIEPKKNGHPDCVISD